MKSERMIMSIDAETDGLWGHPFAVAGILYDCEGNEVDKICLRMPDIVVTNEWVKENVLPELKNVEVTHSIDNESFFSQFDFDIAGSWASEEKARYNMLKDFAEWYMKYKDEAEILYHMGHVVESYLFRELHQLDFIGDFDAPYTPIEVSEVLRQKGFAPDSVDTYAKEFDLDIADYGSTHNPLYDCEVAYKVYRNLTK